MNDASYVVNRPDLPQQLAAALERGVRFSDASLRRLEPELSYGRHLDPPPRDVRPAAVAMLIYRVDDAWHIPFVMRPSKMRHHAGQVAFPGGQVDRGESTAEAALRELEEELGLLRSKPSLIGPLSPINLFVTNFLVHPWVIMLDHRPEFSPCADEVAEVLDPPLAHLVNPRNVEAMKQSRNGVEVTAPCIRWRDHRIWGATAILLGQLLDVLNSLGEGP
ncbi:MAG: CoA pyrophosphatase [Pirellulales bacterium]|nr:CoA pyrophosphatase [Pirellulales bacterium]